MLSRSQTNGKELSLSFVPYGPRIVLRGLGEGLLPLLAKSTPSSRTVGDTEVNGGTSADGHGTGDVAPAVGPELDTMGSASVTMLRASRLKYS